MPSFIFYIIIILNVAVLASSCGPDTQEGYKEESQGIVRSVIEVLRPIHTRDELLAAAPTLKRQFNELADVLIKAYELRKKKPQSPTPVLNVENHALSDELRVELGRIFQIDGGREIIEKCQEEALNRLDAHVTVSDRPH